MKNKLDVKREALIITVLLLIVTVTQGSTDIYVPALPKLSEYFNVSAAKSQLTITAFFLGYFASLLVSGPLSDYLGRRKILFCGSLLFLIGNIICVFSNSMNLLILGRLIVGIGIAPAPIITRATACDLFQGNKLLNIFNLLGLSLVVSLLIAPTIGAFILTWINWRYIFVCLIAYASIVYGFAYICLPNTTVVNQKKLKFASIFEAYPKLLKNREFLTYILCSALSFSGFIIYLQLSPFIFQSQFQFNALQYGATSMVIALAYLTGAIITHFGSNNKSSRLNMYFITLIMIIVGTVIITLSEFNHYNIWFFMTPVYIYITCMRIIFTFSGAKALEKTAPHTGSAASILTMSNAGVSVVASYLIHLIKYKEVVILGSYFIITSLSILILFSLLIKSSATNHTSQSRKKRFGLKMD